jgi:hypothetical protein
MTSDAVHAQLASLGHSADSLGALETAMTRGRTVQGRKRLRDEDAMDDEDGDDGSDDEGVAIKKMALEAGVRDRSLGRREASRDRSSMGLRNVKVHSSFFPLCCPVVMQNSDVVFFKRLTGQGGGGAVRQGDTAREEPGGKEGRGRPKDPEHAAQASALGQAQAGQHLAPVILLFVLYSVCGFIRVLHFQRVEGDEKC